MQAAGSITATDGSHHVALVSPRMLEFMANVETIQGDGTVTVNGGNLRQVEVI